MRSVILLSLLFVVGCRCEEGRIRRVTKCGMPCFTGDPAKAGVGACEMGVWICDEGDESTAICYDDLGPTGETCDGVDNDCNGRVDDSVARLCDTACGAGQEFCTDGAWGGCTAPQPKPEICNGKDDDCDGRFDEDIDTVEFCYDGAPGETRYGTCRPGVRRCVLGVDTCYGEIRASPELCDGIDNDCDGQVDDGIGNTPMVDVLFVIDNSGSMQNTINAVKLAASSFANTYANQPDIRWGLVVAPGPDSAIEGVRLHSNLSDPGTFAAAMQNMNATGSWYEPTLDAIADITDFNNNPLGIDWTPGEVRRVIVLFTDEEPQSYRATPNTALGVSQAISNTRTRTFVFTTSYFGWQWQFVLPPGWGNLRYMSPIASAMEMELKSVLQEVSCR